MFKVIGLLLWTLFFVVAFRLVWVNVLKDYLDKECKDNDIKTKE